MTISVGGVIGVEPTGSSPTASSAARGSHGHGGGELAALSAEALAEALLDLLQRCLLALHGYPLRHLRLHVAGQSTISPMTVATASAAATRVKRRIT
jgi:hypothetical protein